MPPSQLEASSGSVFAHLIIILTFFLVLSFISIPQASADGPQKQQSSTTLGGISASGAMRAGDPAIPSRFAGRISLFPKRRPDNFLTRPLTSWSTLDSLKPTLPSSRNASENGKRTNAAETKFTSPKSVPFLDSVQESGIVIRKGPRAIITPPKDPVPFKPTLAGGTAYWAGGEARSGRFTLDFVLPARLGPASTFFFESRAEYRDPLFRVVSAPERRFDLGLGAGWRTVWSDKGMMGINGFLDTSRLHGEWYSSPGFGVEFAAASSYGIWDITLNMYRGGGIDLKGGVTFPILQECLDMRLYAEKYRFFDGEFILGSKAGVQISSPDRVVAVSYEYGQDSRNPEYHAAGCSLTVPFCLEKVFSGKNPFELPASKSRMARYAQRLHSDTVKRVWSTPDTVVEARHTPQGRRWTTPGRLTDSIFWSKSKTAADTKTSKSDPDARRQPTCCCRREKSGKAGEESTLGSALMKWLLADNTTRGALFSTICLTGATYLAGDYAYRNAFGPFELEPYELEEIGREMPKRHRGK